MNPSPSAVAAIQQEAPNIPGGWAGNGDAQIAEALNAPSVANPAPRATVPTPYTYQQLLGLLSQASLANVYAFPAVHDLFVAVLAMDSSFVAATVALFQAAGKVTADEATALNAAISATEPDPGWPAQISWARANLGRDVDADDIAASRPAQGD